MAVTQKINEAVDRAEKLNAKLNAFITIDREYALSQAKAVEGGAGKLAGIAVALKDNICTEGVRTTCGSKILGDYRAHYDATVTARLRDAGAVIIGKANMDEFAMGSSNESSAFGPVANPWDASRVPGGSSGGSAAAVAAGIVDVALGSETGGSVRQPAALCGIVGFKPTYGRISRYGLVAFASSLDNIGIFGSNTRMVAETLECIAGRDAHDSTSADVLVPEYSKNLDNDIKGKRIGIPRALFGDGLEDDVRHSVEKGIDSFRSMGAEIVDVELPHAKYGIAVYYIIATAEASSNLARFDGVRYGFRAEDAEGLRDMYMKTRAEGFGAEVKRRIMLGTYVLSSGYYDAYYAKGQKVRALIKRDYERAFAGCDAILTPTSPTVAFKSGARIDDPLAMYLSDIFTVSANLAGIPAISVPCGLSSENLPIGLQLTGSAWSEQGLLNLSNVFEKQNPLGAKPAIHVDNLNG
ncbi:MAG: Asp-tRNA(Asn)/Glu-tRNA(Gln) amidotransferase subunit GatA [Acidobacteriota bacterium]